MFVVHTKLWRQNAHKPSFVIMYQVPCESSRHHHLPIRLSTASSTLMPNVSLMSCVHPGVDRPLSLLPGTTTPYIPALVKLGWSFNLDKVFQFPGHNAVCEPDFSNVQIPQYSQVTDLCFAAHRNTKHADRSTERGLNLCFSELPSCVNILCKPAFWNSIFLLRQVPVQEVMIC